MHASFQVRGILSVLQTPFDEGGAVDEVSLAKLIEDGIAAGVDGFLVPVVASEVAWLSAAERERIVRLAAEVSRGRVPLIVGASSDDPRESIDYARLAGEVGAAACLVAVPGGLYGQPEVVVEFFRTIASECPVPLIIQDLQFQEPGLGLETILQLKSTLPTLAGLKIETLPAGPKYTAVREALGAEFFIAGGWAVTQMIEALDRGVDAMMPESSMVRTYVAIDRAYRSGQRDRAVRVFRQLLPVLAFTNQELLTSIAFFKRLLVRKGIFRTARMRAAGFAWDRYNLRIADELIEHYVQLESRL